MTPEPTGAQAVREIYALLRLAAARRQPVAATYDGLLRLLCPHVLGRKSGRLHVFCFQFGGSSNSGLPMEPGRVGGWRCVAIECGLCRSGRARRPAWPEVRRRPEGSESKMAGAGRGGKTVPLGHQEPISCDA